MRLPRLSPRRVFGGCVLACALVLAAASALLWFANARGSPVGLFSLGPDTSVNFVRGTAEVSHIYEYDIAPPVPAPQWHTAAMSRGWTVPVSGRSVVPAFAFSSGHVVGIGGTPNSGPGATVSPARYWLLHVPLWATMLPGMLAAAWLVVRWERRRQERAARPRGFEVLTVAGILKPLGKRSS